MGMLRNMHPIFQQAIDIVNKLLEKNHLTGEQLGALILVGGPTYSPVLRRMLKEQVSPNVDTSIDPMTAVACGAALYASTIDVPEEIVDARRDPSKIQLEVGVKSTSVEDVEYAAVKFLKGKSENYTEEFVFVDFIRNDGEFSTGKVQVSEEGEAVELRLKHDCTNVFTIACYDSTGNKLDCEPNYISIIHGIDGIGDAVLPLPFGFGSVDKNNNVVFTPFEGLKKSMRLPAVGKNSVKLYTDRQLRPGMSSDIIKIPILQATQDIDQLSRNHQKLKMIYCIHIYDAMITGDDVPSLLPAGSEINLTVHADRSGGIEKFEADIPYLDITMDLKPRMEDVRLSDKKYGSIYISEIADAKRRAAELKNDELTRKLNEASEYFSNATDRDSKDKAVEQLKDVLSQIDAEYSLGDWGRMERKLRNMFNELEEDNRKYGNDKTNAQVKQLKEDVDRVIEAQDMEAAKKLYDQLWDLDWKIAEIEFYISWIRQWNRQFDGKKWSNVARARSLVNQGLEIINKGNPTVEELRPIGKELLNMLPYTEKPHNEGLLRQR